jgi:capsular polysaccharide transport system permease protein
VQRTKVEAQAPGLTSVAGSIEPGRVVSFRSPEDRPAIPDHIPIVERRRSAGALSRLWTWVRRRALFLALVILPTVMTTVYMVAIASDQFVSEAHFIVRSANRQTASGLGALLQGTGLSSIRDESYPVTDFLKSRDALRDVSNSVGFRNMVGRTGADFLARFPAFYQDDTFEELFEHYSRIVSVVHDTTTGINTLKVRTFTPEDSRRLAEALLDASERVVNRLNERSLGDSVALAAREVQNAEARSAAAQKALTEYRIASGVVDTSSTAKGFLELIGGLEKELAQSRAQLGQTQASSPNSPGAQSIRDRSARSSSRSPRSGRSSSAPTGR